jgi:hypothetical protein
MTVVARTGMLTDVVAGTGIVNVEKTRRKETLQQRNP